jgi:signal recognition particle GTPase
MRKRFFVCVLQSPIVFLGTGEHFDELDAFNAESFVKVRRHCASHQLCAIRVTHPPRRIRRFDVARSRIYQRLLGLGDIEGLAAHMKDAGIEEKQQVRS